MKRIELYFPGTLMLQYTDASSIRELKRKVTEGKVEVLLDLLKGYSSEDADTTVEILPNYREWFKMMRGRLLRKILGKDVVLFFVKEYPIELDAGEDYFFALEIDEEIANKLMIRKYVAAERLLATDLIFRFIYEVYDEVYPLVKRVKEVREKILNATDETAARVSMVEQSFTPTTRSQGAQIMRIRYPRELNGVISSNLPYMTISGAFQMAVMNFFASNRHLDFGLNASDAFLKNCSENFRKHLLRYRAFLGRLINIMDETMTGVSPVEAFVMDYVKNNGGATLLTLIESGEIYGFDAKSVIEKVYDLKRRGILEENQNTLKIKE